MTLPVSGLLPSDAPGRGRPRRCWRPSRRPSWRWTRPGSRRAPQRPAPATPWRPPACRRHKGLGFKQEVDTSKCARQWRCQLLQSGCTNSGGCVQQMMCTAHAAAPAQARSGSPPACACLCRARAILGDEEHRSGTEKGGEQNDNGRTDKHVTAADRYLAAGGVSWRVDPDSVQSGASTQLGSQTAGVEKGSDVVVRHRGGSSPEQGVCAGAG